jgi:hypothetical protein
MPFLWKCYGKHPRQKFSLKVGTIFEHSPSDWKSGALPHAILVNCKNGISSHEVGRALGVTQKITWFMLHRIRPAIYTNTSSKICGEVEVDETFIGGKARNVHPAQRKRRITATGGADKAAHGFLKRGREVRAVAIPTFSATRLMEK